MPSHTGEDMLSYTEVQYARDTIKETLECDDLDDVRDELEEVLEMLEAVL